MLTIGPRFARANQSVSYPMKLKFIESAVEDSRWMNTPGMLSKTCMWQSKVEKKIFQKGETLFDMACHTPCVIALKLCPIKTCVLKCFDFTYINFK